LLFDKDAAAHTAVLFETKYPILSKDLVGMIKYT
jgi:hypothetical protein